MSIKKRFFFSFGANAFRTVFSFLTGLLLARSLGPNSYGNLAYLLGSFWALRALMDLGASSAFYTFIAQRHRTGAYFSLYFSWLIIQFIVSLLLIFVLLPQSVIDYFWHDQSYELILLALIANYLQNQVWQTVVQIYESKRETIRIQIATLIIVITHFIFVSLCILWDYLNIRTLLWGICVEYFLVIFYFTVRGHKIWYGNAKDNHEESIRQVFNTYISYCKPMVWMALFAFLHEITDRWFLQHFSGSMQQGFYQVALQLSTISLLAANSLLNVLWKEVAEANDRGKIDAVITLYEKSTRVLVVFGACIAGLMAPWSRELTSLLLGKAYYPAWPALMIMLFYPVHQVIGQINATLFMATGQTKLYTFIGNIGLLISIPVSYFLLAPSSGLMISGLGWGAFGLSIKIVALNIIFVNIQSFFIARKYAVPMRWTFQIKSIIFFSSFSYLIYILIAEVGEDLSKALLIKQLVFASLIYVLGICIITFKRPTIIGLEESDISSLREWITSKVKKKLF